MTRGMSRGADKGRGMAESKPDGRRSLGKWASWTTPEATAELLPGDIRALLESRRSPVAGVLIGSVALMLVVAIAWTAWARVDEVVKAQGEVEPAERVKLMNHPRGGRIATLDVIDGQRVSAGQVLLTFAPEIDAKEEAELRGRWQGRLAEIAVLKAEIEDEPLQPSAELLSSRADLVAEAEARLIARREAREGQRDALQRNVEGHRAALRSAEAEIDRLESGTVLLAQQAELGAPAHRARALPAHEDG